MTTQFRIASTLALIAFSLTSHAAVRTWDGGGADVRWSTKENWAGDVAPQNGDDLVFPDGAAQLLNTNDLLTNVGNLRLAGRNFVLGGAGIEIANGVVVEAGSTINLPITTTTAQTFSTAAGEIAIYRSIHIGAPLTFHGGVPRVLDTLSGPGGVVVDGDAALDLAADNTFTGGIRVASGTVFVNDPPGGSKGSGGGSIELAGGGLSGDGFAGEVSAGAGTITPGSTFDFDLSTGNVLLSAGCELRTTVESATTPRHLDVTGTVALNGATLVVTDSVSATAPLTIIDNDGSDAVAGTFAGLPEGSAVISVLGRGYRITYVGGDGNDVVLTPMRTWDGGGADGKWSTAANWVGDLAPAENDDLVFPPAVAKLASTNDLTFTFRNLVIGSGGYVFDGLALKLRGAIHTRFAAGQATLQLPLLMTANQSVFAGGNIAITSDLTTFGTLTFRGDPQRALGADVRVTGVVHGPGALVIADRARVFLSERNVFSGGVTLEGGALDVSNPAGGSPGTGTGPLTMTGGILAGAGSVGAVTATGGVLDPGVFADTSLTTGNLVLGAGSSYTPTLISLTETRHLEVIGSVTIDGAALHAGGGAGGLAPGTSLTIIDNDGVDPVNGFFDGLPEGGVFSAGSPSTTYRVSYAGGDGNDVVITATEADVTLTAAVDVASPHAGEQVTFTFTLRNAGPSAATSVLLRNALPNGLSLVSASASQGTCGSTSPVNCQVGTLGSGASATVSIVARVTTEGRIVNQARAFAFETDPAGANNVASATIDAQAALPAEVPALDGRALAALALLLVLAGGFVLRR